MNTSFLKCEFISRSFAVCQRCMSGLDNASSRVEGSFGGLKEGMWEVVVNEFA